MPHITGHDRSQLLRLPESLDDYVGPESPVRFIEAFVDGLDLSAAGFARVVAITTVAFFVSDASAVRRPDGPAARATRR